AKVSQQRATIEAELAALRTSADELATKTAAWGLHRVDKAMGPLLARINNLETRLSTLDTPANDQSAADDAVAAWNEAMARHDVTAMRAMVKRTFPALALGPQTHYNDHGPHRII